MLSFKIHHNVLVELVDFLKGRLSFIVGLHYKFHANVNERQSIIIKMMAQHREGMKDAVKQGEVEMMKE